MTKKIENNGVSIITIVLNGEKQIEETVESVLSQKGILLEYIIIDGGSTDDTLNRLGKYKSQIDHLVSGKDGGIYQALNKGIALAKYPLIGIIHCGDRYEPEVIAMAYHEFIKTDADVIYGDIKVEEEVSNEASIYQVLKANHLKLIKRMSIFHPATFVKNACYLKHGTYNINYKCAADYDMFLNLYKQKCLFVYIPKTLAVFRTGGMSSKNISQLLNENFIIRKERIGLHSALIYFILNKIKFFYFNSRKSFFTLLIGEQNYLYLKRIKSKL